MTDAAKAGGGRALAAALILLSICGFGVRADAQTSATPTPARSESQTPAPSASPTPSGPPAASATPTPSPSPSDSTETGQIVELVARPVATTEGKASREEVYNAIMASLAAIRAEIDKAGLKPAGNPLAVFLEADDAGFKYRAEIPIPAIPDGKTQLSDTVKLGQSPVGKSMKFEHRGDYDEIDYTYEAITAFLDEKGVDAQDVFIEEYLNEPKTGDDPNLQVDIYVLIKWGGAAAVLFDLDGTLTDSRLGILRSTRHAVARLGEAEGREFALPADEDLHWMIGPPLRDSFAKLVGRENVETLMTFYLERYSSIGAFENHVYDGIPAALDALRAAGARLFVATSKNEDDARRILAHFDLARRFEAIHGARADGGRADKTTLIAYVLGQHALDAARDRVAMVGDRKFDAIGAHNVGIAAIGALWGYGGAEELRAAGADPIVATPAGIPAAVETLFALKR